MKKHNFAYGLLAMVLALGLLGCPIENEDFVSSTDNTVSNNEATLGLTGDEVSSSNINVATAVIASGKIVITSVAKGTATITVSKGANNATISVTVAASGSITIGTIVKYSPGSNMQVYYSNGEEYTNSTKVWAEGVQVGFITNGFLTLYSPLPEPDEDGKDSAEAYSGELTFDPGNVMSSLWDEFNLGATSENIAGDLGFVAAGMDMESWVIYWWFDQSCTLNGTLGGDIEFENVQFTQGWNKVLCTGNETEGYTTTVNPAAFPSGMKWMFLPYN
jgi:hypothetical protein